MTPERIDVVVIGSGMGGATFAAGLAPSGARILILERGERITDRPETRDARAIFQQRRLPTRRNLVRRGGRSVQSRQLLLCRRQHQALWRRADPLSRAGLRADPICRRATPGWPFAYEELEPWYAAPRALYQVHGALGDDPTEPRHSSPYAFPPVPDEPAIAAVRERLAGSACIRFSLPLGVDIDRWLARAKTPWDAFPDADSGKMDAETCGLKAALAHRQCRRSNRRARHAARDRRRRQENRGGGLRMRTASAPSCAPSSSRSRPARSIPAAVAAADGAGRAASPIAPTGRPAFHEPQRFGRARRSTRSHATTRSIRRRSGSTISISTTARGGPPLGNIQLLGRVTAPILKSNIRLAPEWALGSDKQALGGLVRDERGPPESGEPGHCRRRGRSASIGSAAMGRPRDARQGFQGALARGGLSDRPFASFRPTDAVAPVRDGSDRGRPSEVSPRSLLPRLGPSEPFRDRRFLLADIGCGQSVPDDRRSGASRRRPHCEERSSTNLGKGR